MHKIKFAYQYCPFRVLMCYIYDIQKFKMHEFQFITIIRFPCMIWWTCAHYIVVCYFSSVNEYVF